MHQSGVEKSGRIIEVGSGSTVLIDFLLAEGYSALTALDISETALNTIKQRLGARATTINWVTADILTAKLPVQAYDLWHDRAVFHFLTAPKDRRTYLDILLRTLKPGGFVVIATFADDGPQQCSGLDVMRYSPEALVQEFGTAFQLIKSIRKTHLTPWNSEQRFIHCLFQRV